MLSSPSDNGENDSDRNPYNEDDDQDLFPSSDRPSTPKNNHLNANVPGELSPPQSQSTSQRLVDNAAEELIEAGDAAGNGDTDYHKTNGVDGAREMESQRNEKHVPGAGWRSKKANEEYQRAAEALTDRDFSLREFGDLFDDKAFRLQQTDPSSQQQQ